MANLSPEEQTATLSTLKKIFGNVIQNPNDCKYRQIKLANQRFKDEVWKYPFSEELMKTSGWIVEGDDITLRDDSHIQVDLAIISHRLQVSDAYVYINAKL